MRLSELSLDNDEMEDGFYNQDLETHHKIKAGKTKRNKPDHQDLSTLRSLKRRNPERPDF
ncbi:MAG: hypothetical protein ACRBB6_03900 [Neptuniibacter sp.]